MEAIVKLSKVYASLSDVNRIKIVYILMQHNFCATHIEEFVELGQSSVSRHLEKLMCAGVIECKKDGRRKIYSLTSNFISEHNAELLLIKSICKEQFIDVDFDKHKDLCENENTHF